MAIPVPYNTNLSEAQIAEAFRRALNDLTDEQITDLLAQKLSITDIDAELSEESENPVQNKAVTVRLSCIESVQESQGEAIAHKQDTLSTEQLSAINSGIDSTKVAQIAMNENNILKKQNILLYTDRNNATTYSFNGLTSISDNTKFRYGILIGGGTDSNPGKAMIWFVFVGTSEISFFKIIGDGAQTLTGSISDDVLTITSSATIYGGLRLIWLA